MVTLSAVCGNDAALSDGVEKEAKAEYTATGDTDADGKALILDVIRPGTRYARAKVGRATANAEVLAVLAVLVHGQQHPRRGRGRAGPRGERELTKSVGGGAASPPTR